jgi:hypothetical protein
MPLDASFIVRVDPDAGSTLAGAMRQFRFWFNHRKITAGAISARFSGRSYRV